MKVADLFDAMERLMRGGYASDDIYLEVGGDGAIHTDSAKGLIMQEGRVVITGEPG